MDRRKRLMAAVDHPEGSIRQITRTVRLSSSCMVRLRPRRRHARTLAAAPHRIGPAPVVSSGNPERLEDPSGSNPTPPGST
jgi:hypothetical protein